MMDMKQEENPVSLAEVPKDDSLYRTIGYSVLILTFVLFLGWSSMAPLDSAVVASGRVTSETLNKTVQHLDGGLVEQIHVRDGDLVEQGDRLLTLDMKELRILNDNVSGQLLEIRASLERLTAERQGLEKLAFSETTNQLASDKKSREILETQAQLFRSRRDALKSEQEVLQQRLVQGEKQIKSSGGIIKTLRKRLSLIEEDLAGLRRLEAKKLASKAQLREVRRQKAELEGEVIEYQGEITRLKESNLETRHKIALLLKEYNSEVIAMSDELQARELRLIAEQRDLENQMSRIEITAPVSGKVKGFKVVTLGAVIRAGEPIMEIVPRDHRFQIHARISPMDIDVLRPGLRAEVRFPVFDGSQQFSTTYADLLDISTDTYFDELRDEVYYKASLAVEPESMRQLKERELQLVSGMLVDVIIKTGERTLAGYLVTPLRDMLARAFNEA